MTFTCVSDTGNEFEYYASVESCNNIEATFRSNIGNLALVFVSCQTFNNKLWQQFIKDQRMYETQFV